MKIRDIEKTINTKKEEGTEDLTRQITKMLSDILATPTPNTNDETMIVVMGNIPNAGSLDQAK